MRHLPHRGRGLLCHPYAVPARADSIPNLLSTFTSRDSPGTDSLCPETATTRFVAKSRHSIVQEDQVGQRHRHKVTGRNCRWHRLACRHGLTASTAQLATAAASGNVGCGLPCPLRCTPTAGSLCRRNRWPTRCARSMYRGSSRNRGVETCSAHVERALRVADARCGHASRRAGTTVTEDNVAKRRAGPAQAGSQSILPEPL